MSISATVRYRLWKMTDFSSAGYLGDIPVEGVSFSSELNGVGQFNGTVKLTDPSAKGVSPLISPGATALFVDLNGSLAWGGVVWTKNYSRRTQSIAIGGSEFWSYFASRVQAADYTTTWLTTATDPQSIAYTVTHDALAIAGSPPITVSNSAASTSTFWITTSYPSVQRQTVKAIVEALAGQGYLAGGFDFNVGLSYSGGGQPLVNISYSYPRAGRTYGSGGWLAAVDVASDTVFDFSYPEDATGQGTKVYEAAMGGDGYQASDSATVSGWPLLEQVVNHSGVLLPSNNMLAQAAKSDLAVAAWPLVTPKLTTNTTVLGPGIINVGDDLRVMLPPGDPGFPAGWDVVFRVQRMDTKVPDGGGLVTTDFSLNVVPVATPVAPPL